MPIPTKTVTINVELLGKLYPVRCPEPESKALQKAAAFLNEQMLEVKESGKAINLERIAIISALNIAYLFLSLDEQKDTTLDKLSQRILQIQSKLENALNKNLQTELTYSTESV